MHVAEAPLPKLLTADHLAKQLGLSRHRIYELARVGALPTIHVGRSVRFSAQAVADWLESGGTCAEEGSKADRSA